MKRLGSLFMLLGAIVGLGAAAWIGIGLERAGLPWLVAVGLVKLTIAAALGIMAAGAVLTRVANRSADRETTRQLLAELEVERIPAQGELRSQQDQQVGSVHAEEERPLQSREPRA